MFVMAAVSAALPVAAGSAQPVAARSSARHHRIKHRRRHHRRKHRRHYQVAPHQATTTPAPTPSPAPPPAPVTASISTQQPPAPSPERLIFDDEFAGAAGTAPSASNWSFDVGGGGWGDKQLQSYTARTQNASLDGEGDLRITARSEPYTGTDGIRRVYTSARLQTLGKFDFRYGRAEARIKVPAGQGLVAQFWALGNEAYERAFAWPTCGEIDMMEVLGSQPDVVLGHVHGPWPWLPNDGLGASSTAPAALSGGFHTYGAIWQPERVIFTLDGTPYGTFTPADLPPGAPWPFAHPFFLLLDLAVGGGWPGPPTSSTHFPASMLVDWVRVWQ